MSRNSRVAASPFNAKSQHEVTLADSDLPGVEHPHRREELETPLQKLAIFPASILTTVVSLLLVASLEDEWFINGASYGWILRNRAGAQIIVQVLAGILGGAQVSTVRSLVSYYTRRTLAHRPITLDWLSFYNSIVTSQVNWSLPLYSLLVVLTTVLIALAPAALWAGALTPIVTSVLNPSNQTISVPTYTEASQSFWNQSWETAGMTQTAKGIYSYGAIRSRYGYFINDGSTASSLNGGLPLVKKGDNSNYTYHGRSYGVGSSAGIADCW